MNMKAKYLLSVLVLFLFTVSCKQNVHSDLNLGFEKIERMMPVGWIINPPSSEALYSLDSNIVHSGKYSMSIEFNGDANVQHTILLITPQRYKGKNITVSGYLKTENITDGWAGLAMFLPVEYKYIDMRNNGITGTTDWKKYEIMFEMNPEINQYFNIGGVLAGKGKMWIDDLTITIDGKDIQTIPPLIRKNFSEKAKKDKEFDKGSDIVFPELTEQTIDDLELLGRIWGFMKYHHPAIATGDYNWDYELFRLLLTYLKAIDNKQRDEILIKWINQYGKIPKCKTCQETPDSAYIKPDLLWIENGGISLKLKDILNKIYLNRNQNGNYYINIDNSGNYSLFTNERAYENMNFPDAGFRLLALYRYWNIIHYFFPYKYLTDKDWNTVLHEYIPYFLATINEQEYRLTSTRLITEICDSHAELPEKVAGYSKIDLQVPAYVQFIEDKLVVLDYYFEDAKLKKGDIITHVNGKSVEAIVDSIKKYIPASNDAVKLRGMKSEILHFNTSSSVSFDSNLNPYVSINYISNADIYEQKNIFLDDRYTWRRKEPRQFNKSDDTQGYRFIDKDIGYISNKTVKDDDIPAIKIAFVNTKGIIIDLRDYNADALLAKSLAPWFVSDTKPFVMSTYVNVNNPGEFTFQHTQVIGKREQDTYRGKLVVIVNEDTQSNSEYKAMAFRVGDNTTIIGSQTAGADGPVEKIILPGGLETRITSVGMYYPDGSGTQRVGIIPDIEVKPTIKGVLEGRDELLEKAIEIIKQE